MNTLLAFRGRALSDQDIELINELIANHPDASRWALSKLLCSAWNWVQQNGASKDMLARSLMLFLHRGGHICLPPVRRVNPNPLARRRSPPKVEVDQTPIEGPLKALLPLKFVLVRRTPREKLFNSLLANWHYLGYTQPVGAHLKYLLYDNSDRLLAAFAIGSAPRHLGPRDRYIGWSRASRKRNIGHVAYNSRFLILPWVRVPHLASHILGRLARRVSQDWEKVYGHPLYLLETFVDPARNRGTCYKAANWVNVGQTTGRGKDDHTNRVNRSIKDVLCYPLVKGFRRALSVEEGEAIRTDEAQED